MSNSTARDSQLAMAHYLRRPATAPPPAGVEQRRLDIYLQLVYNNIEGFLSGGFPVLRSLYSDADWHDLVRAFIDGHRCHTPYFLEISQEFIEFLMNEHRRRECDPAFMVELAHYEWAELALDVAEAEPPPQCGPVDILAAVPRLSPLAWLLCYQYPVHHIGPGFRPDAPTQPTYLVVYRDRQERVRFMELNAVSARLVELTRGNTTATGARLLQDLAAETGMPAPDLLEFGAAQLTELVACAVLGLLPDAPDPDTTVAPVRQSA
ncbi:MAG: putative DNA-binding domain-containing protein [Halioglobus sp.]|nr:putative DNA-binding domain-containing protein [Halioglobus sp.]MCB1708207.1 putative DNA-binding domain-containing protein [Halioglobus sp.]MCP5122052.1 putative DNA-binding domain-containing protein [Pseudomonadales bacterium]MCP5192402.1 putative DNA-binding domain-containing protein [Pseudomonadales bacterium]